MLKTKEHEVQCVYCKRTKDELLGGKKKSRSIGGKQLICLDCDQTPETSAIFEDYVIGNDGLMREHPSSLKKKMAASEEEDLYEDVYSPRFIYNHLDRYVAGHNEVKRQLSVAVSNHIKRFENPNLPKETILLTGRTGMGKTYLVETLGNIINVPFASVDASSLTGAGWVGDDVKSVIEALYYRSGKNLEASEKGIILLDEFDKKCSNANAKQANIDTTAVQQQLLRMIEGEKVTIGRDNAKVTIDTSNILFILSGSFEGHIVKSSSKKIGLNDSIEGPEVTSKEVYGDDWFLSLGMVRELMGRITTVATLGDLSVDEVIDAIFHRDDSAFGHYVSLCSEYGFTLKIGREYSRSMAMEIIQKPFGMRMAKRILADRVNPLLFDCSKLDGKIVTLHKDRVRVSSPKQDS